MRYEGLKLEKGMYAENGKSFSQVLEELDPSEQYRGTGLEKLDAFERQLKRFDIRVSGKGSDSIEKFFHTSASAALFPEYVKRAVMTGAEEMNLLGEIVASRTVIDSLDYRSITLVTEQKDKELKAVAEGAQIPSARIKTRENLVKLFKRGRMLAASYEALRFQKLDLFTVALKQIGAQIARQQLADAIGVLIDGDGNENAAAVIKLTEGLTYQDLLNFWAEFEDFELNTMLADATAMLHILGIQELQDPMAGLNFQGTGKLPTPLGAALLKSRAVPKATLIGLDRSCALEMVTAGEIAVEYDKLIDRQLERAAITSTAGFAKIFDGAVKVLKLKAE